MYPLSNFPEILNYTLEMCYNNISAVEVCVLHSLPRTPLRSPPLPFLGTPSTISWYRQEPSYCTKTDFHFHYVFVSFVRSITFVDMPLNIHESGKYVVGKQLFMF